MPDFYSTGSDQSGDLTPNLMEAARAADELRRSGVRAVPAPTELPPLNLQALLRMNPVQAAMVIRARKMQQNQNAASDQNAQALINSTLNEQTYRSRLADKRAEDERRTANDNALIQKERKNQATEYAAQLGDVLPKYQEATAAKDKAAADLAEIAKFATTQRLNRTVNFTPDKTTKPDPKTGVFIVPPGTFSAPPAPKVAGIITRAFDSSLMTQADADRTGKVRQEVASSLNDEFAKRTEAANKAIAQWHEATKELQEADKSLRKPGFLFRDGAVHDIFTKKSYPVGPSSKNFDYDPDYPKFLRPVK